MPDAPTQPAEPLDRAVRSVYRAIWNSDYDGDVDLKGRTAAHALAEQMAGALAKHGLLAPPMAEGLDYSALADACDDYLDAYRGDGPDERIGVAAARVRGAAGLPAAPAAQSAINVTVDREANAAYVRVAEGVVFRTAEINGSVNADYDRGAQLLGVEILDLPLAPAAPADDEATRAITEVAEELSKAQVKFAPFNSTHEGYAVILEELDELWAEVKANDVPRSIEEAVQVAAMALRYIVDCRAALAALREGQQR